MMLSAGSLAATDVSGPITTSTADAYSTAMRDANTELSGCSAPSMSTNIPTVSAEKLPIPWYTVLLPVLTVTLSAVASASATASVKLSPDGAIAAISPSRASTLPFSGLVGCDD